MNNRDALEHVDDRAFVRVDCALLVVLPDCTNFSHTLALKMRAAVGTGAAGC